jgi:hypothetical protein
MALKPFYFDVPKVSNAEIANADASNLKTVVTGAPNGSKVNSLTLASDDTAAREVQLGVTQNAGAFFPLGTVSVPITAGTVAATPAVNALNRTACPGLPLDSDGNPYLLLESGDTLQIKALTTVTATKKIYATALHGDDA